MKNKPFFSIITCTYNSEKFLERNIKSVLAQTFNNYEYIFIDGYSTDKTYKIISKYQRKYPEKIKVFRHEAKGVANAFNKGIEHSSGIFLIHLNSDDYFNSKESLEHAYDFLKSHQEADWIYGKIDVMNEDGKRVGSFPKFKIFQKSDAKILKLVDYIPHQTVFIKRSVFDKFGYFDEKVKYITDYEYWLRIADKTRWFFINETISSFTARVDSVSLSRKHKKELKYDTLKFHKKYSSPFEHFIFSMLNYSVFTDIYRHFRYRV